MMTDLENLTFILGGARSGKSTLAEKIALESGERVLYCATAEVLDDEMRRRVEIHRSRRPETWGTLEAPLHAAEKLKKELEAERYGLVLMDCLSVLTSNALLQMEEHIAEKDAWDRFSGEELGPLLELIALKKDIRWIIVSNETGMGIVPAYELGRQYRDLLGRANQAAAAAAGTFYFMAAGVPLRMKPTPEYR